MVVKKDKKSKTDEAGTLQDKKNNKKVETKDVKAKKTAGE